MLALLGSVLVPLVVAGLRSVFWILFGLAGLALTAAGVWWALAHTALVRVTGMVLSIAAPVTVLAVFAAYGMLWPAAVSLALWALAVLAARTALTPDDAGRAVAHAERPAVAPRHPWIVMNPRSGDGKVARFGLVEKARAAGARVTLLDPGQRQDVAELARRAVADGADLLAVAGGDGTQALVAEVAWRCDLPFAVVPAGTRNHFALDLGLDRDDPAAALDALADGVELRVDLGFAADRVFVNNASFGAYAAVVGDPAYRDDKTRTALRALPGLLSGDGAPRLRMRTPAVRLDGLQALLVSNNAYRRAVDLANPGRRERLDAGELGVLCVRIDNTARAAGALRGPSSAAVTRLTATEVVVETDPDPAPHPRTDSLPAAVDATAVPGSGTVPAGIDGEAVSLPTPVVCRIVPGALRVRVPRDRPGTPVSRPPADWPRVARIALAAGRGRPGRHARAG
nr:diacylglycerol kinase family protein [Streptomyces sp. CRN 30]